MSAIQARIHYSMKQEFRLLKDIIADYAPEDYDYEPAEGGRAAKKADYETTTIIPVSDPNAATMSQKVVQYQAVLQLSQTAPQLYNLPYLHRQMLEVIGIKNAEKLVPMPDDMKPLDPVTENVNALKNQPLKAFPYQDHQAHIQIHLAAMNDPKIKQIIGQNPQAPMIMQAMQAHITEHVGLEYKRQMEQGMGMSIPDFSDDPDAGFTPEQEMAITRMAVPTAQNLLNQNQTEVAARNAQQAAQDPIVQMQMKELQLKAQEVDIKMKKMQMEAAAKADQLEIEKQRIAAQKEIAGMQVGAKAQSDKMNLAAKQKVEGLKIGAEIGRNRKQIEETRDANTLRTITDIVKQTSEHKHQQKMQELQPKKEPK